MKKISLMAVACAAAIPASAFASCGSAFCAVNTNWTSESALIEAGDSFDLRYEYIDQDQPRSGTSDIAVGQIHHHHDEVGTVNRNLLPTYSHAFASGWGIAIAAPIADRDHVHVHNHHGQQIDEQWSFTSLGDARVTGRYQLPSIGDPLKPSMAGVIFGLKLPTGRTNVSNAEGDVAERSLQPGTGTTDAILGAYYHQKFSGNRASWFTQVQYQHALDRHDEFKPGAQLGADLGFRYGVNDKLAGLFQINAVVKGRDRGAQAEPDDSGSRSLFASPGVAYTFSEGLQMYGYLQLPVYQKVNGVQLTARRALTVGLAGKF